MRKKSREAILTSAVALVLSGISIPACKSAKEEVPVYRVEKNTHYDDLVEDIVTRGKITSIPAEKYPVKGPRQGKKLLVCPVDILPIEMDGAENFETKSSSVLMQETGTISQKLHLPKGKNRIIVQARGEIADGEMARMRVMVDESEVGMVDVLPELRKYVFPAELKKGRHQIHLSFLNGDGKRKLIISNLYVRRVFVSPVEFFQEFVASRLLDDTLNKPTAPASVIMGKIGSVVRRSLFMPSPCQAEVSLKIPENAFLQFAAGIDERVWENRLSGCEFLVSFTDADGKQVLYEKSFQPFGKREDRQWQEVEIDLSGFGNKKGILRFETNSLSSEQERGNLSLGYFLLAHPRVLSSSRPRAPNVILISIDTLRRDHLGLYGYEKEVSPFLDAMTDDAAVFERVVAQAPYTVTSHMTMMTSLWPRVHQILIHLYQQRLSTNWLTLPQILNARGYMTAGFTGGGQVSAVYGFDRGMDIYDYKGGKSGIIFPKAIKWMERARGNPFFLFLHTYDPHVPYDPPPPYDTIFDPDYKGNILQWTEENVVITDPDLFNRIIDLYDGEIRYADSQIQGVIQFLKDEGLYDHTMIIITSDHGEEFMEHGAMAFHSHTLYNELLLVPLLIKFPEGRWGGRRIHDLVALNDLMPTVLDYLGLPFPTYCQGESLLTYMKEETVPHPKRRVFSERIASTDTSQVEVSLQDMNEKYCQKVFTEDEYFDLAEDPGEQKNLLESQKSKASELLQQVTDYIKFCTKLAERGLEDRENRRQVMDSATIEKLKALGYIK